MVLTEKYHLAVNRCTMETDRATAEDPVFGQSGSANEVEATRQPIPPGWQAANTSGSCSELGNIFGHNVGPNSLQKVMAGDLINTSVFYYFQAVSGNTNSNAVSNILTCLVGAMGGTATAGSLVGENVSSIATNLGNNTSFLSLLDPSSPPPNTPQAYLTVLFFDERFNPVPSSDGGVYQAQVASTWVANANLGFNNIKVPKNGYVYIYVSNLSDQSVYFDNMAVAITAGNIAEEDHYYPFGLKIASICSRRLGDANEGTIKNNYLYNEKELFDDGQLNWYDYGFRNYDPQIGRFLQMDPITDYLPSVSPYQYAFNDPITNIDKDGLIGGIPCPLPPGSSVGFLGDMVNSLTTVLNALSPALSYVTMAANISITTAQISGSYLYNNDNSPFKKPWTYTYQPPSQNPIHFQPRGLGNNDGPPEDYRNAWLKAFGAGVLGAKAYDVYRDYMDHLLESQPDKVKIAPTFPPAPAKNH